MLLHREEFFACRKRVLLGFFLNKCPPLDKRWREDFYLNLTRQVERWPTMNTKPFRLLRPCLWIYELFLLISGTPHFHTSFMVIFFRWGQRSHLWKNWKSYLFGGLFSLINAFSASNFGGESLTSISFIKTIVSPIAGGDPLSTACTVKL